MKYLCILILFVSLQGYTQFHKTDSLVNFYVIDHKLVWQKWYPLEDRNALNSMLKGNNFTSELDLLKFSTSVRTKPTRLEGYQLPEYAQHEFVAFLSVDLIGGRYRVSIKQIVFPDFTEKIYYNGRRQRDSRGTLEQYILRQDGLIKRNNANTNVLFSFDELFSGIFDPMAGEEQE